MRYLPEFRDTKEAIEKIRLLAPSGEHVSLAQLTDVRIVDCASAIYREANQRYVAIKYGVRERDLGGAVQEAIKKVETQVKMPPGYHIDWAGEYESQQRAQRRLAVIIPLTLLVIFFVLYSMFKSLKWAALILMNVAMAPVGGLVALYLTGTNLSVSSGVGFLALFGVSAQVGIILVECINQLRIADEPILDAAKDGAVLKLRPIMMTMLVAALGLVPAATSHGIGSDSQRPFAIVIVGGLLAALLMSIFYCRPCTFGWPTNGTSFHDLKKAIQTSSLRRPSWHEHRPGPAKLARFTEMVQGRDQQAMREPLFELVTWLKDHISVADRMAVSTTRRTGAPPFAKVSN
jgi:cobalt-zinc-cadmium resistance protein CzcA